jgi:hypothetical protein
VHTEQSYDFGEVISSWQLAKGIIKLYIVLLLFLGDMVELSLGANSEQMVEKNEDAGEDQETPAPPKEVIYG